MNKFVIGAVAVVVISLTVTGCGPQVAKQDQAMVHDKPPLDKASKDGQVNMIVRNNSGADVEIYFWSGFGKQSAPLGTFRRGEHKSTAIDRGQIPGVSTVFWRRLGSLEESEQNVNFEDIFKESNSRSIVLEIKANNQWVVTSDR